MTRGTEDAEGSVGSAGGDCSEAEVGLRLSYLFVAALGLLCLCHLFLFLSLLHWLGVLCIMLSRIGEGG